MSTNRTIIFGVVLATIEFNALCFAVDSNSVYSPIGKRDPFNIPKLSLRDPASAENELFRYQVEQFELKAVLKSAESSQILIADPKGNTYILKEGDELGRSRAKISRILEKEVILTEKVTNYLGLQGLTEKVLSLPTEDTSREK
jgi:Tfp pilus assembly protein PilP